MKSIEMQHIAGLSPSSSLPSSSSSSSPSVSTITTNNATTATVAPSVQGPQTASRTASSQHFCLRWNNYQTNLTTVFDQLLQNESFVDVTLVCENHSIKAHKMVLSACSPYFQSLFYDNPCQHPIIIFTDVKWPEMKAIVDFMYRGEINVSHDQISPLLKVAEILKIRGLTDVNSNDKDLYFESTATGDLITDTVKNTGQRTTAEISVDLTSPRVLAAGNQRNTVAVESANLAVPFTTKGRKRFRHSTTDTPIVRSPKSMVTDHEKDIADPSESLNTIAISALDCTVTATANTATPANTNGQLVDDFVPIVDDMDDNEDSNENHNDIDLINNGIDIKPELGDIDNGGGAGDDDNNDGDDDDDNGDNDDADDDNQQQQQQQLGNNIDNDIGQHHKPNPILAAAAAAAAAASTAIDDTEIKPGIAEMIREEERDTFPATSCANPDSLPATVVAAVAQNLRQQMCNMVVAAQHQQGNGGGAGTGTGAIGSDSSNVANFVNSLAFAAAASCGGGGGGSNENGNATNNSNEMNLVSGLGMRNLPESLTITPTSTRTQSGLAAAAAAAAAAMNAPFGDDSSIGGESVQDLRMNSPLDSNSDSRSPTMDMLEPALNLDVGLDMSSLACASYRNSTGSGNGNSGGGGNGSSGADTGTNSHLFHHDDLDDIVKSTTDSDVGISLKIEPLDCRSE